MPEIKYPPHVVAACDAASASDREWFKANPHRSHRIRRALFGEVPLHPDLLCFVAVRQIAPGVRIRVGFRGPSPAPPYEAGEVEADLVFQDVLSEHDQGRPLIDAMEQIAWEGQK